MIKYKCERFLFQWIGSNLPKYILLNLFYLVSEIGSVVSFWLVGSIMNSLEQISSKNNINLHVYLYAIALVVSVTVFAQFMSKYLDFKLSNEGLIALESIHLDYVMHADLEYVMSRNKIELAQQINNDCVLLVDYWIEKFPILLIKSLKVILILFILSTISIVASGMVLACGLVYLCLYACVRKVYTKKKTHMLNAQMGYFGVLGGELLNVFLVKANAWYASTLKNFNSAGNEFVKKSISFLELDYLLENFLQVISMISTIAIPLILIFHGTGEVGSILVVVTLIQLAFPAMQGVFGCAKDLATKNVAATRLEKILDIPKDQNGEIVTKDISSVEIKDISFSYKNNDKSRIIEQMNLHMKKGNLVFLVGKNGSGKSTFIKLLMGLLVPSEGGIYMNDTPLQELNMEDVRKERISFCEQEPYLVSGTVTENLNYGLNLSKMEEEFYEYKLLEFVKHLPQGYATEIEPQSANLSGGQKQRIAICRALAKSAASIYIFDEPSSALDEDGIHQLNQIFEKLKETSLVIVISHDEKLFSKADHVIYFDQCEISVK